MFNSVDNRPIVKYCPAQGACYVGVTYVYDETGMTNGVGRLTTASDIDASGANTCKTTYSYDYAGRVASSSVTLHGYANPYTISKTYDDAGRTTGITYPDHETVNYTYDNDSNLSGVTNHAIFSGFNALGQPGQITFQNGANTTLSYYASNNRLLELMTTSPGSGTVQDLKYDLYDSNGNIKSITGLYYYGARYYDPAAGVFVGADSLIQAPTNPRAATNGQIQCFRVTEGFASGVWFDAVA